MRGDGPDRFHPKREPVSPAIARIAAAAAAERSVALILLSRASTHGRPRGVGPVHTCLPGAQQHPLATLCASQATLRADSGAPLRVRSSTLLYVARARNARQCEKPHDGLMVVGCAHPEWAQAIPLRSDSLSRRRATTAASATTAKRPGVRRPLQREAHGERRRRACARRRCDRRSGGDSLYPTCTCNCGSPCPFRRSKQKPCVPAKG